VAGPPALQTAIDDDITVGQADFPVLLPLIRNEAN